MSHPTQRDPISSSNGHATGDLLSAQADTSFDPAALDSRMPRQPEVPDPFDPASLKISQDFAAATGVKKALMTVPVRKPDKSWFVRTAPTEDYRLQTAVLELKEDREVYLVAPHLRQELSAESTFGLRVIFTAINRQNVLFLWPVTLPSADGKQNEWHRSALEAATRAATRWVRVQANMSLGAYECYEAVNELSEPTWPDLPFGQILRIAFKDKFIDSPSHPVLRRLRGEV